MHVILVSLNPIFWICLIIIANHLKTLISFLKLSFVLNFPVFSSIMIRSHPQILSLTLIIFIILV